MDIVYNDGTTKYGTYGDIDGTTIMFGEFEQGTKIDGCVIHCDSTKIVL